MRYIIEFDRVMFDIGTDLDFIWNKYSWYTFKLINVEFEWDKYCGSLEFMFSLIGFNLRIAIAIPNKLSEENNERWSKAINKFFKKKKSVSVNAALRKSLQEIKD